MATVDNASHWTNITVGGEHTRVHLGHVINNIHITSSLAHGVYRKCINSSEKFHAIAAHIASFRSLLEITEEKLQERGADQKYSPQINTVVGECKMSLTALDKAVEGYNELPISTQRTWERLDWGESEINDLKERLGMSVQSLAALNSIMTSTSIAAVQSMLERFILEVRTGKREGSVVSRASIMSRNSIVSRTGSVDSLNSDEREAWRVVRRELQDVGITPEIFNQHRGWIISTLQTKLSDGEFCEALPLIDPTESAPVVPTFNYLQIPSTNNGLRKSKSLDGGDRTRLAVERDEMLSAVPVENTETGTTLPVRTRSNRVGKALGILFLSQAAKNKKLCKAAESGDQDDFQAALAMDAEINTNVEGQTPLHYASRSGKTDIVHLLLLKGAEVNGLDVWGGTALHAAASKRHPEVVQILVRSGANTEIKMDHTEQSPLISACMIRSNHMAIEALLQAGAKTEAMNSESETSLMLAVNRGGFRTVKLLLKYGANVDGVKGKLTPLTIVTELHKPDFGMARILVEHGANVDELDQDGTTALMRTAYWAHEGSYEFCKVLLLWGANIRALNSDGTTALEMVRQRLNDPSTSGQYIPMYAKKKKLLKRYEDLEDKGKRPPRPPLPSPLNAVYVQQ